MSKQLTMDLFPRKMLPHNGLPHPAMVKLSDAKGKVEVRVGVIRNNSDTGPLMRAIGDIGMKHHDFDIFPN